MRNRWIAAGAVAWLAAAGVAGAQPLEALPAILHLQLSQHPAWRAYKDALAETHADETGAVADVSRLNAMTTPARLDALRTQLAAQEQSLDRQAAATLSFYAVLSPDQKRLFDEVTRQPAPPSPLRRQPRANSAQGGPDTLRQPPAGATLPPPAS